MRLGFISLFCICFILGFIPKPEAILSRIDRHQGEGWYIISQSVSFQEKSSLSHFVQMRETWWRGPDLLFLRVTLPSDSKLKAYFIYQDGFKTWMDSEGQLIKQQADFIEPYFGPQTLRPTWLSLVEKAHLSRAQGVVNYLIAQEDHKMWVEQDEFVIRQILFSKDSLLEVFKFQTAYRKLRFPTQRKLITPKYTVLMDTKKITSLADTDIKKELKKNQWTHSITDSQMEMVQQFYQNVR